MNKRILIGALVAIVILGAVAWLLSSYGGSLVGTNTGSNAKPGVVLYQQLQSGNSSFTQGVTAFNAGNYAEAASQFTQALPSSQSAAQTNIVNIYLASALEDQGQYAQAISVFKSIVSSSQNQFTRAYAVQRLGQMFYTFRDPSITQAIFAGDPYQGMVVKGDDSASYRNLFAYATTLYPLATSEYRVAQWYANDYLSLSKGVSPSASAQATDISAANKALEAGDTDLPRLLANVGSAPQDYVAALNVRTIVIGTLSVAGNTSYNPDATYKQLLQAYATYGVPDGYARIAYASFIVNSAGTKRSSDVATVLAPLYQGSLVIHGVGLSSYLKNGESSSTRALYVKIAQNDPRFETLLISLGWSSSDFK